MNEDGFTLIEMMIVLLIISVLILIAIPNVTKHSQTIDKKGCKAYVQMVQGQVEAYKIDNNRVPTVGELVADSYLTENPACPNGKKITISDSGKVDAP